MALSFTYVFTDSGKQDFITLNVATPATNSTGLGLSYSITSITGTIGGTAITGQYGTGGSFQRDPNGDYFDNAVFLSNQSGRSGGSNYQPSSYGVDYYGIEFSIGTAVYNIYTINATFYLYSPTLGTSSNLTLLASNAPCYCPGTLIRTANGDVAVEDLVVGDLIVTMSGAARPILWIGRRSYAGRFLRANPDVQPILFKAGSLDGHLPTRDLAVSPDHAMFLQGVLVPARCLVNGSTIRQERGRTDVTYVHVELDSHDILLAEGAPSESFVDDDSRGLFHNAAEWERLYPGRPRVPAAFCAPRVEDGPTLEAVRQRLAKFAEELTLVA